MKSFSIMFNLLFMGIMNSTKLVISWPSKQIELNKFSPVSIFFAIYWVKSCTKLEDHTWKQQLLSLNKSNHQFECEMERALVRDS